MLLSLSMAYSLRCAFINGSNAWTATRRIVGKAVHIVNCGDIHPRGDDVDPFFPNAELVRVTGCNKNFIFYWLSHGTFPNVKDIFLESHPCSPNVFNRFDPHWPKPTEAYQRTRIYLLDQYGWYRQRWAPNADYITVLNQKEMDAEFDKLLVKK